MKRRTRSMMAAFVGLIVCALSCQAAGAGGFTATFAKSGGGSSGTGRDGSTAGPHVAPYVDMLLYPTFDLASALSASGIKDYTLAFVVDGRGCKASWGGVMPVSDAPFASDIAALRSAGGDVIVSFGGQNGTELAAGCTSLAALAAQYQAVIETYNLTSVDFDIEGAALADHASINRRSQAIAILEHNAAAAGRPLHVSLTLPVLPTGLTSDGMNVIKSALATGARIDLINVMAMDYGDYNAPKGSTQMGQYAINAAQATHDQLVTLYPQASRAQLWTMIGVTPMIGVNDLSNEIFTLTNASQLVAFARKQHLGRLSFWSATRDHPCPGGALTYAKPTCSSTLRSWAFSTTFDRFRPSRRRAGSPLAVGRVSARTGPSLAGD